MVRCVEARSSFELHSTPSAAIVSIQPYSCSDLGARSGPSRHHAGDYVNQSPGVVEFVTRASKPVDRPGPNELSEALWMISSHDLCRQRMVASSQQRRLERVACLQGPSSSQPGRSSKSTIPIRASDTVPFVLLTPGRPRRPPNGSARPSPRVAAELGRACLRFYQTNERCSQFKAIRHGCRTLRPERC